VSDQVSYPHTTIIGRVVVLYILIFKFLNNNLEDKRLHKMISKIPHLYTNSRHVVWSLY
jgi:hypothetical protein